MSSNQAALSEVELKVELTSTDEVIRIKNLLIEFGFAFESSKLLNEYYITKTPSKLGGWDFERLRQIGNDTFLRTLKQWSTDDNSNVIRLEQEHQISKDEFKRITDTGYELHFTKTREDYKGTVDGKKYTVSIDTLTFSGVDHYYLECEVITPQTEAHDARVALIEWMRSALKIAPLIEAPSMIDIVTKIAKKS